MKSKSTRRVRSPFGTDGIRGRVGVWPVTPDFALKFGWCLGRILHEIHGEQKEPAYRVVIGKDTRISSYLFETAIQAGLISAGVDVLLLGPMPTPAIAWLTRSLHAQAGIVISASHNHYHDNGLKVFDGSGQKIAAEFQNQITSWLKRDLVMPLNGILGKPQRINDAAGRYIEFCKSAIPVSLSLKGLRVILDCANGAAYHIAPKIFSELGAEVISININPDGLNINKDCGSTAPQNLQKEVLRHRADIGIAFDGDADRVAMVDHQGDLLDGDELLYIIARHRRHMRRDCPGIVGTVMSNAGLPKSLEQLNIKFERAQVGDRFVSRCMQDLGWPLGGEPSGHIICGEITTTGDGIVAALLVLQAMVDLDKKLAKLREACVMFPQIVKNVSNKSGITDPYEEDEIVAAISAAEKKIREADQRGRVLLRCSGTEPIIRVLVEGENSGLVKQLVDDLAETVERVSAG